nr:MAG TPA: hypothetical protein [Inoviridae sp.]
MNLIAFGFFFAYYSCSYLNNINYIYQLIFYILITV